MIMDTTIQFILEKVLAGERLDLNDGLTLFKSPDLRAILVGNPIEEV